ncbi:MAG: hypothetical protein KF754_11840, partial [Planctomycetes bacterium]|nr:hypothetical protein [Planctomycetota bacterium]
GIRQAGGFVHRAPCIAFRVSLQRCPVPLQSTVFAPGDASNMNQSGLQHFALEKHLILDRAFAFAVATAYHPCHAFEPQHPWRRGLVVELFFRELRRLVVMARPQAPGDYSGRFCFCRTSTAFTVDGPQQRNAGQ